MIKHYSQLIKFRLSATVVFSALCGYLLGVSEPLIFEILLLLIGWLLVTGSANAINQTIEKDQDRLMNRTTTRPLPSNNLSVLESLVFAFFIGFIGLYCGLLFLQDKGNGL